MIAPQAHSGDITRLSDAAEDAIMTAKSKPSRQEPAPKTVHASPGAERKKRQSDLLDEALVETFPASDPISVFRL